MNGDSQKDMSESQDGDKEQETGQSNDQTSEIIRGVKDHEMTGDTVEMQSDGPGQWKDQAVDPEIDLMEGAWNCSCCGPDIKEIMAADCAECGEGICESEMQVSLLGLDVVALFPSITSKNTGITS